MKMPNIIKGPRITFFIKEGTETILVKQMPFLPAKEAAEWRRTHKRPNGTAASTAQSPSKKRQAKRRKKAA